MRKRLQTGVLLSLLVMMLFAAPIASAESVAGTDLASGTDVNTGTEENTATRENTGTVLPILELHQVNLGSADGYVIRFDGTTVLIDGGEAWPNLPERIFPKYLEALGIAHVDVYIITHWHDDHCMNLNYVLERYGDESTIVYGVSEKLNAAYDPLANGAQYRQMKDGDEFFIGGGKLLKVNCVGPETVRNNGLSNMDSLNFLLTYGEKRILFTADYASSGNMNRKYRELLTYIDVLKFPHHGIREDSGDFVIGTAITKVLTPMYVLVPGSAAVWDIWSFTVAYSNEQRLTRDHIYTNKHGNILMFTDGADIVFRTEVDPADYAQYQVKRALSE